MAALAADLGVRRTYAHREHPVTGRAARLVLAVVSGLVACCGNEDEVRLTPPDRRHTAHSYLRNCGATTDYVTVVELEAPGFSRGAPVYSADGAQQLRMRWPSSTELVIECAACSPHHPAALPVDGVTITVVALTASRAGTP